MQSFIPTDPVLVKPRVPTPHAKLKDGLYVMEFEGVSVVARIQLGAASKAPLFRVVDGHWNPVTFVKEARFYRLPEGMQ
jgi:hypothetical protein